MAFVFVLVLALALAELTTGVTFTDEFEKSLGSRLAVINADVQAYDGLKYVLEGFPSDVPSWAKLATTSDIATELRVFSTTQKGTVERLLASDPANADKINTFGKHATEFVDFFFASIRSDTVTVAPPSTAPPATTTKTPRATKETAASRGAGSDSTLRREPVAAGDEWSTPMPTFTPRVPAFVPTTGIQEIHISPKIHVWQLVLFVAAGVMLVLKAIHWNIKREEKKRLAKIQETEEQVAARAVSRGDASESTFVAISSTTAIHDGTHKSPV